MKPKYLQMSQEAFDEALDNDCGRAVVEMLMRGDAWNTFCTLTTFDVCSQERMRKIIFRTFSLHRPLKGCEYFWVLEPFHSREGVHAHVLVRNEPEGHRWAMPRNQSTGGWYIKKFGRFQSNPVARGDMFKVSAYLAKYMAKEIGGGGLNRKMREGCFGFGNDLKLLLEEKPPEKTGSKIREVPGDVLTTDMAMWSASKHHRRQRNCYRAPARDRDQDSPEMETALAAFKVNAPTIWDKKSA